MTRAGSSNFLALTLNEGFPSPANIRFGRFLILSLTLHFSLLLIAEGLRILPSPQPELVAHEVSLVTLSPSTAVKKSRRKTRVKKSSPKPAAKSKPVPAVAQASPPPSAVAKAPLPTVAKAQPVAPPVPQHPLPPKAVVRAPLPLPSVSGERSSHEARSRAVAQLENALGGIELPPDTPEFGDLAFTPDLTPPPKVPVPTSPVPTPPPPKALVAPPALPTVPAPDNQRAQQPAELQKDIRSLLDNLKVPEVPRTLTAPAPRSQTRVAKRTRKSSLSGALQTELQEIEQRLERERKRRQNLKQARQPGALADPSQRQASIAHKESNLSQPATRIQADGKSLESNDYMARVQYEIARHWIAPPLDSFGQSLVVVVKFRLHRSGTVSNLAIEETSGNEYYDLAGKRAVLAADPLPVFPPSLSDAYLDTHFTFMIGEQKG